MRLSPIIFILLALLLFSSFVSAEKGSSSSENSGKGSSHSLVISSIPLSTASAYSLREWVVSSRSAEKVLVSQRADYDSLKKKILDAPSSEQPLLTEQLSLQRQNVRIATLNKLILVYTRLSFAISSMEKGLLTIRSRPSVKNSLELSARVDALESRRASLSSRLDSIHLLLEKSPTTPDASSALRQSKSELQSVLPDVRALAVDYQSLVRAVISSS